MRARAVLGVLLALTAAGVVVTLSHRGERLTGTNGVRPAGLTVAVLGGETACQPRATLPGGTGAIALLVSADRRPLPPLTLRFVAASGRAVAQGSVTGGRHEGRLTVPLAGTVSHARLTLACVHNGGRAPIALGGEPGTPASGARVGDRPAQGVVALTYLRPGRQSWWPLLGGIAHRFGLGKAQVFGGWTLWVAAGLVLCLWIAVARLLLSERPR
jgi:hypothetical protein